MLIKKYNRGFTLVELAIVLVIIGLLISGILVSRSMIQTAKISKTIKFLSDSDIAISNFKTKYKGIPGDSNKISCPGTGFTGNNNNIFDGGGFPELQSSWCSLSVGTGYKNFKSQTYGIMNVWAHPTHESCPWLPLDSSKNGTPCFYMQYYTPTHLPYGKTPFYIYATYIPNGYIANGQYTGTVKPIDAFALDKKLDDGLSVYANQPYGIYGDTAGSNGNCRSGDNYVVDNDNYSCVLYIQIGLTNGNTN